MTGDHVRGTLGDGSGASGRDRLGSVRISPALRPAPISGGIGLLIGHAFA